MFGLLYKNALKHKKTSIKTLFVFHSNFFFWWLCLFLCPLQFSIFFIFYLPFIVKKNWWWFVSFYGIVPNSKIWKFLYQATQNIKKIYLWETLESFKMVPKMPFFHILTLRNKVPNHVFEFQNALVFLEINWFAYDSSCFLYKNKQMCTILCN